MSSKKVTSSQAKPVTKGGGLFDLESQFSFYGAYHTNTINILVHIIFVPTILWSALVFCSNTGPLINKSVWPSELKDFEPNLGLFVAAFYALYYIALEPMAGLIYAPFVIFLSISANWFRDAFPNHDTLAVGINGLSWVAQFAGHGFAEGRAPALLDNLVQAFLLAPFFVFIEVLFYFGYRPELRKRVDARIEAAKVQLEAKDRIKKAKKAQ